MERNQKREQQTWMMIMKRQRRQTDSQKPNTKQQVGKFDGDDRKRRKRGKHDRPSSRKKTSKHSCHVSVPFLASHRAFTRIKSKQKALAVYKVRECGDAMRESLTIFQNKPVGVTIDLPTIIQIEIFITGVHEAFTHHRFSRAMNQIFIDRTLKMIPRIPTHRRSAEEWEHNKGKQIHEAMPRNNETSSKTWKNNKTMKNHEHKSQKKRRQHDELSLTKGNEWTNASEIKRGISKSAKGRNVKKRKRETKSSGIQSHTMKRSREQLTERVHYPKQAWKKAESWWRKKSHKSTKQRTQNASQ